MKKKGKKKTERSKDVKASTSIAEIQIPRHLLELERLLEERIEKGEWIPATHGGYTRPEGLEKIEKKKKERKKGSKK